MGGGEQITQLVEIEPLKAGSSYIPLCKLSIGCGSYCKERVWLNRVTGDA